MDIQLEKFSVNMADGQNCIIKEISEKGGVTKTVFRFCWNEENAARNDSFTVS
ncbi:MAG: hypothetical protein IK085_05660 [Clostridia bacterium]|nr:hypothetical protein [Clostridia bacterium]